ncbi:MAG: hypothetical protein V4459_11670 [Pseudomonadota bacterium]
MVNMGNVWDRTTEFLSDNVGAILPIAALAILLPQTIALLIKPDSPAESTMLLQVIGLALTIPSLWGQLAIVALSLDPDAGRSPAIAAGTRALGPAIIVMLVLFAAVIVAAIPIVVALVAGGVDLEAMMKGGTQIGLTGGTRTFVLLYGVVLVVALFVLSVRMAMLCPVIVAEKTMLGAIGRSFALGRGILWKMIGVWLVFFLVYTVAYMAATSVVGALFGLISPDPGQYSVGHIVVALLGALVTTAFRLLIAAFSAKLYLAATAAREGSAPRA